MNDENKKSRSALMKLPNLQQARYGKGWSQEDLAEKSGVARSIISNLENLSSGCQAKTAKKLADSLNLEIWQLASTEGSDLQCRSSATNSAGS